MIAALVALAWAEVPEGLRPMLAPPDVHERWRQARPDAPAGLACAPALDGGAQLCFRVWDGRVRRYVTTADLATWGVGVAELEGAVRAGAKARIEQLSAARIAGSASDDPAATYWIATDGDGWAVSALLHPEVLAGRVGGESVRIAVPRTGVLLAWASGSADRDRILAVAAREMFESADDAVSPEVWAWTGSRFAPLMRAVPRGG